jgi:hypothetical protein
MGFGRINESFITQENHNPQDAIDLGSAVVKVTIKCLLNSAQNCSVGWGVPGGSGNTLIPGESVTYFCEGLCLDKNMLYIGFPTGAAGGKALVSIINEAG